MVIAGMVLIWLTAGIAHRADRYDRQVQACEDFRLWHGRMPQEMIEACHEEWEAEQERTFYR